MVPMRLGRGGPRKPDEGRAKAHLGEGCWGAVREGPHPGEKGGGCGKGRGSQRKGIPKKNMRTAWIIALIYVQALDLLTTLVFLPFGYEMNPIMSVLMPAWSPLPAMLAAKVAAVAVCLWAWRRSAYRPSVIGAATALSSLAPLWNLGIAAWRLRGAGL